MKRLANIMLAAALVGTFFHLYDGHYWICQLLLLGAVTLYILRAIYIDASRP